MIIPSRPYIIYLKLSPSLITCLEVPPIARMQAWGGFMTAAKLWMPNIPRLETAMVPPWYSSGLSLLFFAFSANSFIELEMAERPFKLACLMMGVTRPLPVSTATETSQCLNLGWLCDELTDKIKKCLINDIFKENISLDYHPSPTLIFLLSDLIAKPLAINFGNIDWSMSSSFDKYIIETDLAGSHLIPFFSHSNK